MTWGMEEPGIMGHGTDLSQNIQNHCHFADDIFKLIFMCEDCTNLIQISMIFVL